jgi:hypothetical protein
VIHWPSYNQSLVRRGEILFAYDFLDMGDYNRDRMNENKKGKPYSFPDSFILIIGYIRIYFHLSYRQTEGVIKATGKNLPDHLCYSQICRRLNKLDITSNRMDVDDGIFDVKEVFLLNILSSFFCFIKLSSNLPYLYITLFGKSYDLSFI